MDLRKSNGAPAMAARRPDRRRGPLAAIEALFESGFGSLEAAGH